MKVKKYVAPSMPEAMKLIRNDLGKDAVILNSKIVHKGGVFGLFTKKNIEVIAAVDPQPLRKQSTGSPKTSQPKAKFDHSQSRPLQNRSDKTTSSYENHPRNERAENYDKYQPAGLIQGNEKTYKPDFRINDNQHQYDQVEYDRQRPSERVENIQPTSMPNHSLQNQQSPKTNDAVHISDQFLNETKVVNSEKKEHFDRKEEVQQQLQEKMNENKSDSPNEEAHSNAFVTTPNILKEIQDLKKMMKEISHEVNQNYDYYPPLFKDMNYHLIEQGVSDKLRQDILSTMVGKWYINEKKATKDDLKSWVKDDLIRKLSQYKYGGVSYNKRYLNVVGPTGVGKTTTLAKIAAESVLIHQKRVAFITTDTYRIAAIEQLKTYAKILGMPLEVAYNIEDFKNAAEKFVNYDLVLIDTAGRNFRNQQYVQDLKEIINFNEEIETCLVLALTSKEKDMNEIYKQFSSIVIDKLIFTKVDETSEFGAMMNLITTYNVGVAYLTNGQNVPDDIIEASPNVIANLILEVENYDGSS